MTMSLADLQRLAGATGFRAETLEKVLLLLGLLDAIRAHPYTGPRVALKGGTALNRPPGQTLRRGRRRSWRTADTSSVSCCRSGRTSEPSSTESMTEGRSSQRSSQTTSGCAPSSRLTRRWRGRR